MNNLAIIPARGGSKRIPRKNIKAFLGKPIIAYSINAALESGLFKEVMVSTDDEEIADVAIKYGAKVPFLRSKVNAGDYSTTFSVITEVLNKYRQTGLMFDNACCIYPTAPLVNIAHLKEGVAKLNKKNLSAVYPAVQFSYPIWRGIYITEEGKSKMVWPEYLQTRSQDLEPVYHDAGQWYWFKTTHQESLTSDNSGIVILKEEEVQDIDTESDWKIAELKYKLIFER
ncbi:pseudaminic acid cytidylyltransferase [Mucilaginibacter sp. UYCu711]|uniref:pseudaminic acid cytidylyltransferase n=1 Tax=Mucilaginibacter sp. UYCu711 TaxID=3156339 RepID=UPI003D1C8338